MLLLYHVSIRCRLPGIIQTISDMSILYSLQLALYFLSSNIHYDDLVQTSSTLDYAHLFRYYPEQDPITKIVSKTPRSILGRTSVTSSPLFL